MKFRVVLRDPNAIIRDDIVTAVIWEMETSTTGLTEAEVKLIAEQRATEYIERMCRWFKNGCMTVEFEFKKDGSLAIGPVLP